jgi:hypothetical protein
MPEPASNVTTIMPRLTQRRLRMLAFARRFAETMDAGEAYRDIYRPAENPKPTDKHHGERMLRVPMVQQFVAELVKPALVTLGVDKMHAIRRLIETIDGDVTDYVKVVPSRDGRDQAELMSAAEIREALPLAKRRLIKKIKITHDQYGGIKSREIELESKQAALELLAKLQGWIKTDAHIHIDGDDMLRRIDEARAAAPDKAAVIIGEFQKTATFTQLSRPRALALPPPEKKK